LQDEIKTKTKINYKTKTTLCVYLQVYIAWHSALKQHCVYMCLFAGLHCVAQCTLDSCWYRAEVLDVRRKADFIEMSIIFVDYGSTDYICDASK